MLRDVTFQCTVTKDKGVVYVSVMELEELGQWRWLADAEFGPFDTRLDVYHWLWRKVFDRLPAMAGQ